jgi:cytochrome P450
MAESTVIKPAVRADRIPFLNDYLRFRNDPLNFWLETGKIGPLVRVNFGPAREMWVVTDPDLFQQILQKKSKNFPRDRQLRTRNGIDDSRTVFNAETYDEWRWRRRLLQPGFHRKQIEKFAETMVSETQRLTDETADGLTINLTNFMKKLTMRIICQTMFSASLAETDRLQHSFEQASEFSYSQLSSIVKTPIWLPTAAVRETKRSVATKKEILGRIVQERLDSDEPQGDAEHSWDMLDMLISAQLDDEDETNGRSFDYEDLVAEMGSLVFAGHETTAMTMVWLMNVVATMPDVEAKLLAEIDEVLGDRTPTLADLDLMPYTHQVVQETLRLFPSIYVTLRESEAADELEAAGQIYSIPAGTQFILNIRGLHRMEQHWPDADHFMPERFSAENSQDRHKFAYQPFISGPKKCIGDQFAMMEMRLAVPTLLQNLRFEPVSSHPAEIVAETAKEAAGFVMETERPVLMKVRNQ